MSADVVATLDGAGGGAGGDLALAAPTGTLAGGTAKLAQRFLLELLTVPGTLAAQPSRGCSFLTDLYTRTFASEFDVLASLAAALVDVRRNLQAEESDSDPPQERYGGARATRVVLAPGVLVLTLRVRSLAGPAADTTLSAAIDLSL